jgi:hypothetical protein
MRAWKGWTATASVPTTAAPTWADWRARQQRILRDEQLRRHCLPFTERELAHLLFVRWLYQTGRLGPQERDTV